MVCQGHNVVGLYTKQKLVAVNKALLQENKYCFEEKSDLLFHK